MPHPLVLVSPHTHGVVLDLAYATANNIAGRPIYDRAHCLLHRDAEACLRRAVLAAAVAGYRGAALYRDAPTVVAEGLITASAMHPLEFARDIFAVLQLYTDEVLAAWYGLYKTGEARYFATLGKTTQG